MASVWDFASGRLPSMVVAELALLVTLTSADSAISTLSAKALREMAIAESSPNTRRDETEDSAEAEEAAKRFPVYDQLGDPTVLTVGEYWLRIDPFVFANGLAAQVAWHIRRESGSYYAC